MLDKGKLLWIAREKKSEECHMDEALRRGYTFDFSFELQTAVRGLKGIDYTGLYIANLCFQDETRAPGLELVDIAKKRDIPVLVRAHNDGDKEICARRGIEIVEKIQLRIYGQRYLLERFDKIFVAKSSSHQ
jgi:hypothetical protein